MDTIELCHRNLGEVGEANENRGHAMRLQVPRPALARLALALLALGGASCASFEGAPVAPGPVECRSLLGIPLAPPVLEPARREALEAALREAEAAHAAAPDSEEAAIWHGRRLAYLARYREAIAVFSEAIERHPRSYRLRRHRGHRRITLRQFEAATSDLMEAAQLARGVPDEYEEDGAPNAANLPRSTRQSNIYYHLGLALFLQGRYEEAEVALRRCAFFSSVNDDMLVATRYWRVLTLWRLQREEEARALLRELPKRPFLLENQDYDRLLRFYESGRGEAELWRASQARGVSGSTLAFGLAAWHLEQGATLRAHRALQEALGSENWAAFGYIAAEVELARSAGGSR